MGRSWEPQVFKEQLREVTSLVSEQFVPWDRTSSVSPGRSASRTETAGDQEVGPVERMYGSGSPSPLLEWVE